MQPFKIPCLFLLAVLAFGAASCKKDIYKLVDEKQPMVYDTVSNLSPSRIISFAVKNTGEDPIKASVDDQAKVITVYLPYFYQLQLMEPQISLPDGATISPAASELVPVFPEQPFTYTVTARNGERSVYTVKTIIQQPQLTINELSRPEQEPTAIDFNQYFAYIEVSGVNFLPFYAVTTLVVVDDQGHDVLTCSEWDGSGFMTTTSMPFQILSSKKGLLHPGQDYYLEIRCYTLKARMQLPVRFIL